MLNLILGDDGLTENYSFPSYCWHHGSHDSNAGGSLGSIYNDALQFIS